MSFIQVFSEAECAEIAARPGKRFYFPEHDEAEEEYVTRCKNIIRDFLVTKGIELNMSKASWTVCVNIKSHENTKEWHHDDVTILNFVINVRGEGTSVLMDDGTIGMLPLGYGCILVGDQGYTMLGLHPTLHRGPPHDNDRAIMHVMLIPNFKITHWISGESVCDERTNVETYNDRKARLETLLLEAQIDVTKQTAPLNMDFIRTLTGDNDRVKVSYDDSGVVFRPLSKTP